MIRAMCWLMLAWCLKSILWLGSSEWIRIGWCKYTTYNRWWTWGLFNLKSVTNSKDDELNVKRRSVTQNAKSLCLYIWDNYVEYNLPRMHLNLDWRMRWMSSWLVLAKGVMVLKISFEIEVFTSHCPIWRYRYWGNSERGGQFLRKPWTEEYRRCRRR